MRTLKESLIEEETLFLVSYSYLREALESNRNGDYNACLSNIEKAKQKLDEAINLRNQNKEELDRWKMKIEAELPD
jgi:cellobiose-specific phosphotransferase system component IIA